jgi:hypothetical protein
MTQHATTPAGNPATKLAELQRLRKELLQRIVKNETRRKTDTK